MQILLSEILHLDPKQYKLHFGFWNGKHHPLDEWVEDPARWVRWQVYRGSKVRWTRRYIFSLMQMYHEGNDRYLFGGVFEVIAVHRDHHEVKLTDIASPLIGRLKVRSPYSGRKRDVFFDKHYADGGKYPMQVAEILPAPYGGRPFPGYLDIDVSFGELKALASRDPPDWKSPLANVKGIYLITDRSTNRRYVGSAYGDFGIWSRWKSYLDTGDGGNVGLRALLEKQEDRLAYCRRNFRFALLEHRSVSTPDDVIRDREKWWKEVLLSRDFGHNRN